MAEENRSQGLRFKNIDETKKLLHLLNYEQNEFMYKKNKNVCLILNYIEYFLILAVTYISISAFASLIYNPEGITSSTIELKV